MKTLERQEEAKLAAAVRAEEAMLQWWGEEERLVGV